MHNQCMEKSITLSRQQYEAILNLVQQIVDMTPTKDNEAPYAHALGRCQGLAIDAKSRLEVYAR